MLQPNYISTSTHPLMYTRRNYDGSYAHWGPEKVSKMRLYVSLDASVEPAFNEFYVKQYKRQVPDICDNTEAGQKAWKHYRKSQLNWQFNAIKKVLFARGYESVTFHFSQYAGCTCPCSPGYIVDVYTAYDIHTRLTWSEKKVECFNSYDEWKLSESTRQESMFPELVPAEAVKC